MFDQAIILAAGLGQRMMPLTANVPKPLVKMAGLPMIDYAIKNFQSANIKRIVVNGYHLQHLVFQHLVIKHKKTFFSPEKSHLETGGGMLNAISNGKLENRPFFCANSDSIILMKEPQKMLQKMQDVFVRNNADIVLVLQEKVKIKNYTAPADFKVLPNDNVVHRLSLKNPEEATHVFTGLQLVNPLVFLKAQNAKMPCKLGDKFSINLFYKKHNINNLKLKICGVSLSGMYYHIGTIEELKTNKINREDLDWCKS